MDTHCRAVGHLARSFFLIPPAPLIKGGAQRAGGSEIGNDLLDWRRITRLRRWTRHNKKCAADSPPSAATEGEKRSGVEIRPHVKSGRKALTSC